MSKFVNTMNASILIVLGIFLAGIFVCDASQSLTSSLEGIRCDSCGQECSLVCGSRQFRTCCFNYIKKRSVTPSFIFAKIPGQLPAFIPSDDDDTIMHQNADLRYFLTAGSRLQRQTPWDNAALMEPERMEYPGKKLSST